MKRKFIFAFNTLAVSVMILIGAVSSSLAEVSVTLRFDCLSPQNKQMEDVPPDYRCSLKVGSQVEVFPYSGDRDVAERIITKLKFSADDIASLSIADYPPEMDVLYLFGLFASTKIVVFPRKNTPQKWSRYNHLTGTGCDDLVQLAFAESRVRWRKTIRHSAGRGTGCLRMRSASPSQYFLPNNVTSRIDCVRGAKACGVAVIEGGGNVYCPDLDAMLICDSVDRDKVCAVCHFTGGDNPPFEGNGRGLPQALSDLVIQDFKIISCEDLLDRELGLDIHGLGGRELAEKILNDPRKEKALELLNTDVAENKFGKWYFQFSAYSTQFQAQEKVNDLKYLVFVSEDGRVRVVTQNEKVVCAIVSLNNS